MDKKEFAAKIDHTMLKPEATQETVIRYCKEAREHGFASVCVNTCHAALVTKELSGSEVKTCVVVGFPLGAMSTASKVFEAVDAVKNGATEVDMVINIGAVKEGRLSFAEEDIRAVVKGVKAENNKALVKVIIETCLLTDEEKVKACEISEKAGADFVKTSTGFSTGGATVEDIALMRKTVGDRLQVKASGGIRTHEQALELIQAGADRIGAGNGVVLL